MKVARCRRCLRPIESAEAFSFYPGGPRRFVNLHQACARDLEGGGTMSPYFAAKAGAAAVVRLGGRMYKRGAFIAVEWAPHNRPPWPLTFCGKSEVVPIPRGKRRRDRRRPSKPGRRR